MTPPKLGLVTLGWPGTNTSNGIATAVFHLANGLCKINHPPVILTRNVDASPPDDIPFVTFKNPRWRFTDKLRNKLGNQFIPHDLRAKAIAKAVRAAVEEHGLDVVLVEETYGWVGPLVDLVPVPVVAVLHGPWAMLAPHIMGKETPADRKRQAREARALQKVAGILAPSQASMAVTADLPGCRNTPKAVIPNAIELGAAPTRTYSDKNMRILFVGRFDRLKGADTILEAFQLLCARHPHAQLTFVGPDTGLQQIGGPYLKMTETLARLPKAISSRIHYTGKLSRDDIVELRSTHDIVAIASRFENLNYTLLEAMVAGQAIVCTDVGGPAEILENGITALVVPPSDPAAMADALGQLHEDRELRRRLGENAREEVVKNYSPAVIAAKTLDFIHTILRRERP